jgi:site-specific DNA recombinase
MTSAAIYARVSSARQKKDQTIGSQTAALREHAARNGLEVPAEWVFEDEGHSGATLVRPGLEALRDLAAQGCIDVILCYSPDRLARKFAYQALLIEEFTRAGVRVEFIKNGARGDSPEDQLLVQFQGMFAEYEKAQLMERYRRGKAHRARTGSVNVLSGAPFGYRYLRKTDHAGAAYEIAEDEAVLVAELFRRYADEGASIADLARWLTSQGVPTRTGKRRWDRSVIWAMLRNPAYAGTAVFGKTMAVHQPAGLNRVARLQGRSVPRPVKTVDRPREEWTGDPRPGHRDRRDVRAGAAAAGRQQAVRRPQHQGPLAAADRRPRRPGRRPGRLPQGRRRPRRIPHPAAHQHHRSHRRRPPESAAAAGQRRPHRARKGHHPPPHPHPRRRRHHQPPRHRARHGG